MHNSFRDERYLDATREPPGAITGESVEADGQSGVTHEATRKGRQEP